jgi:asparagine synthase (glutamine-hydrolysing)
VCGIAGILSLDKGLVEAAPLERMVDRIRHRGPDACGSWAGGPIALGHARLSIIDLEGGAQPMPNPAGTLQITFNGEIFNYRELREDLIARGHRFATRSDTEVILHLYEERGEACVEALNGQWAFAIWDAPRKRLFLARDRLGIRPLYYTRVGDLFLFASEIKAIFEHPAMSRRLDLRALDEVFTFWCSIAPRTVFEGVEELPPGHCMRVEDGRIGVWPYWRLNYRGSDRGLGDEECVERLRELLVDSTRLRLRSDVPVGAYLSGGLDSSTIIAMIKLFTDTPLKTFSVAFEDPEYDESRFQMEVSQHLDTDHREVQCSNEDIGAVFREVIWHAESPLIRTAPAPLYILSGLVRENDFKVVLTGEGADEVLGGYDIFKEAKIRRFWGAMPDSKLRPLLLKRLYPYLKNIQAQSDAYRKAFFHVNPEDLESPFFSHIPRWELTSGLKRFYSKDVRAELDGFDVYAGVRDLLPREYASWDPFEQAQFLETTILMPGYILSSQGDRMAMGHSVEGRFPFLDHRVVEFAASLRPQLKMKVLDEKHVLKRAMGHLIPVSVTRRPKQPYRAPDAVSLLGDAEGRGRPEYVDELLSPTRARADGYFNPLALDKLLRKFEKGRAIGIRDNMALVGILSTQLLVDQFINGSRS